MPCASSRLGRLRVPRRRSGYRDVRRARGPRIEILQDGDADERRQIAILDKGDFFGEMSLLEELPAQCDGPSPRRDSTLIEINGALFDRMLRRNPEIAVRIMRKLSGREYARPTSTCRSRCSGEDPTGQDAPEDDRCRRPTIPTHVPLPHAACGVRHRVRARSRRAGDRRPRSIPVTGIEPEPRPERARHRALEQPPARQDHSRRGGDLSSSRRLERSMGPSSTAAGYRLRSRKRSTTASACASAWSSSCSRVGAAQLVGDRRRTMTATVTRAVGSPPVGRPLQPVGRGL